MGQPEDPAPQGRPVPSTAQQIEELGRRFNYFAPTPERAVRHGTVRQVLLDAAIEITGLTKPSAEQTLAIRKLEEAMFWANAAIAREG